MDFRGKIGRYRGIYTFCVLWDNIQTTKKQTFVQYGLHRVSDAINTLNIPFSKHTKREDAHFQSALSAINI